MTPKISVIIPIYNREKTLEVSIRSVLHQEYLDFELILVNDGSEDRSEEICKSLSKEDSRIIYISQSNKGVSAARNLGISMSKGEWITFLDSDDIYLPTHLNSVLCSKCCDFIMTETCNGKIVNGYLITDSTDIPFKTIIKEDAANYIMSKEYNPFSNIFYYRSQFFRRQILEKYNIKFDESMSLGEDLVFTCNYLCYAKSMCHIKKPTYVILEWTKLEHLGRQIRTPENLLYNQRKSYEALLHLYNVKSGDLTLQYANNFGYDRPITRILYGYIRGNYNNSLSKQEFLYFLKTNIAPFLRSIVSSHSSSIRIDVRIISKLIIDSHYKSAIVFSFFYCKFVEPTINRLRFIKQYFKKKYDKRF